MTINKRTRANTVKIIKAAEDIVKADGGIIVGAGRTQLKGFLDFIRTQGVVGLAVGLVLGGAVSIVVKSLVDNIIMPPLGFLLGSAEGLKGLSFTLGETADGIPAILHYGVFLNDLINFIIIALVVYFVFRVLKIEKIDKKKN